MTKVWVAEIHFNDGDWHKNGQGSQFDGVYKNVEFAKLTYDNLHPGNMTYRSNQWFVAEDGTSMHKSLGESVLSDYPRFKYRGDCFVVLTECEVIEE